MPLPIGTTTPSYEGEWCSSRWINIHHQRWQQYDRSRQEQQTGSFTLAAGSGTVPPRPFVECCKNMERCPQCCSLREVCWIELMILISRQLTATIKRKEMKANQMQRRSSADNYEDTQTVPFGSFSTYLDCFSSYMSPSATSDSN